VLCAMSLTRPAPSPTGRAADLIAAPSRVSVYLLLSFSIDLADQRVNRKAWSGFGRLGCLLGALGTSWDALRVALRALGRLLEGSWGDFRISWGLLGRSGAVLGLLGDLGRLLGRSGSPLPPPPALDENGAKLSYPAFPDFIAPQLLSI